jgi:hypothetical protein
MDGAAGWNLDRVGQSPQQAFANLARAKAVVICFSSPVSPITLSGFL